MEFTEVSAAQLAELEAGSRSGYAAEAIQEFRASGLQAADFSNSFGERKLSNVANALKRLTQRSEYADIKVTYVKRDGAEHLIVSRVGTTPSDED